MSKGRFGKSRCLNNDSLPDVLAKVNPIPLRHEMKPTAKLCNGKWVVNINEGQGSIQKKKFQLRFQTAD